MVVGFGAVSLLGLAALLAVCGAALAVIGWLDTRYKTANLLRADQG